jgi:uncharacterized protein YjiS (DUF1127 family)
MTTIAFHPTTRLFHTGLFTRLRTMIALWRARAYDRAQLAQWDDRDLHDAGISRSMLEYELNKPFWRE